MQLQVAEGHPPCKVTEGHLPSAGARWEGSEATLPSSGQYFSEVQMMR
jgi:hypothetical protein